MGSFADELAADYADAIGGYEQTFEWNGDTYPCVRSTDAAGMSLREQGGGFEPENITDRLAVTLPLVSVDGVPAPAGASPQFGDLIDTFSLQVKKLDPNVGHIILWAGPPDGAATHG